MKAVLLLAERLRQRLRIAKGEATPTVTGQRAQPISASQQEPLAYRFGGDERNASESPIPSDCKPTIVDLGK